MRYMTDEQNNRLQDQHEQVLWAISNAYALVFLPAGVHQTLKGTERSAEETGRAITKQLKKYLRLLPEWSWAEDGEEDCYDPYEDER